MSTEGNKAVFLSYASQDATAARKICDALRAAGVEVWFDQSELVGGDAWDAKIRQQIKECALFLPIISANTQARAEGYFRIEWRLADRRTEAMGKSKAFLVPISIDDTRDSGADVPDSFLAVQWTRLPGGETSAAFCERVKKLLAGPAEAERPRAEKRDEGVASPVQVTAGRRVPATVWIAAAVVVLAGIAWYAQRRNEPAPPAAAAEATLSKSTAKSAAAPTEAQLLVAKAAKIIDEGDELNREKYFLAEDLAKKAVALDPAEPAVWMLQARLSYLMQWHNVDLSESRRDAMRRQAERARALGSGSIDDEVTLADVRIQLRQDLTHFEPDLLSLAARAPGNWRVQRSLGTLYRFLGRRDESILAYRRAHDLSGGVAIAEGDLANVLIRSGRFAEAEPVLRTALARHQSGRLLVFNQWFLTRWQRDLTGAKSALETWPDWLLSEDRGAVLAWQTWLWSRQYDKALAAAQPQRLPRDYLNDTFFTGPRAVTAIAHEGLGHTEAARADWRSTLQLADRELAAAPTDIAASYWKAWALARLGDTTAAQAVSAQMQQRNQLSVDADSPIMAQRTSTAVYFGSLAAAPLWATVGRPDLALAELRKGQALVDLFPLTRRTLELDPAFDPLRADPEFQEILARYPVPDEKPAPQTRAVGAEKNLAPAERSIAVLAFENRSGEKSDDSFSDGISEELLNVLSKVSGLTVMARASSFYFKGRNTAAQEIGRKLGVAHLVSGSVQQMGNSVRIFAELIRTDTGVQVWAQRFDGDLTNPWELQDRIAGRIADELKLKLGAPARATKSVNPEAYRLVLEGRHFWNQRTDEGFAAAESALRKALALDSRFAEAHAGLADVAVMRAVYRQLEGETDVTADLARTREEAQRALALDASLPEPPAALAYASMLERKLADTEREYQQILAVNPNHSMVHTWHGVSQFYTGRLDLALEEFERAIALDPLHFIHLHMASDALTLAGRLDEALALDARAAALRSYVWPPNRGELAALLWQKGRKDEAIAAARFVRQLWPQKPRWFADSNAIWVLQQAGLHDEAGAYAAQVLKELPETNSHRGLVLAAVGKFGDALPYLERCGIMTNRNLFWAPLWDRWRDNPRFQQLLVRLGCAEEYKVARATLARMQK